MNTRTEFLEIADRIGARLCRDALWSGGRCNWTGEFREDDSIVLRALGPQVYQGTAGVAMFLWRLAETTGDGVIRRTAEGALRQALSKLPQRGCGFYSGGMGIRFAAALIRGEVDEEGALAEASTNRELLDVIGGSAGCIGALLALHRMRGGSRWLEAASAHADLLLAEAARSDEGWSWRTAPGPRNLTGFSHGTAGIGWALLEVWQATGESRFRAGGMEAFRYERSCFDAARRNWPDFRQETISYPAVWCHGAGGIGFARLRAWQLLGEDCLLAEARIALGTVAEALEADGNGCLCHGIAGNADLLVYATEVLGEEQWRAQAEETGRQMAARYERRSIPWRCVQAGVETPGLMTGIAGTGYHYLRLAGADAPTVLIPGVAGAG